MPRSRSLSELVEMQQNRSSARDEENGLSAGSARGLTEAGSGGSTKPSESAKVTGSGGIASSQRTETTQAEIGLLGEKNETDDNLANIIKLASVIGCWVAAEYYPRGSDDWFRCRNWVLTHPRLVDVYVRHGEWLAGQIHQRVWLRWLFRPLVSWAHRRGSL